MSVHNESHVGKNTITMGMVPMAMPSYHAMAMPMPWAWHWKAHNFNNNMTPDQKHEIMLIRT